MFTIKHYSGGTLRVYAALSYERPKDRPNYLGLTAAPGTGSGMPSELTLLPDDEVYIENLSGKTIDLIRPPRP